MADNKKKNVRLKEVTEQVDHTTGEVVSQTRHTSYLVDKEPDYVKLYIDDIVRLNGLAPADSKVLTSLLKNMGYNNIIPVYKPIKKLICKDLGIAINTLNKAIDNLYKRDILIRVDRGLYMADPELFGRGKWQDIQSIRMTVTYDKDGKKKISSEVDKEQLRLF